jgi:hypothetical protein
MYARRFQVELVIGGERRPCPLDWLDAFAMRNFTGSAEFDDTLPLAEGLLEAGFRVDPARLADAFAAWLNRRGKGGGQPVTVEIREEKSGKLREGKASGGAAG